MGPAVTATCCCDGGAAVEKPASSSACSAAPSAVAAAARCCRVNRARLPVPGALCLPEGFTVAGGADGAGSCSGDTVPVTGSNPATAPPGTTAPGVQLLATRAGAVGSTVAATDTPGGFGRPTEAAIMGPGTAGGPTKLPASITAELRLGRGGAGRGAAASTSSHAKSSAASNPKAVALEIIWPAWKACLNCAATSAASPGVSSTASRYGSTSPPSSSTVERKREYESTSTQCERSSLTTSATASASISDRSLHLTAPRPASIHCANWMRELMRPRFTIQNCFVCTVAGLWTVDSGNRDESLKSRKLRTGRPAGRWGIECLI